MTEKKYTILDRETLFQGWYRVQRYHIQHERFDGTMSPRLTREVFHRSKQIAGVLLFDPMQDKVVMVEQFRTGTLLLEEYPWMTEIVVGMIDANETPETAARREALEEANCTVTELQRIATYYTSPGGTSEQAVLFVGRTEAPPDGSLHGLAHEGEDIRVHVMDAMKAIGMIYQGKIRDAQTLIAMQWFSMHHTELRSRWMVSDVATPII